MKKAYYKNWGYPAVGPELAAVSYIIANGCCYFTADNRDTVSATVEVTSTLNAAEQIVAAIAGQEQVELLALRYFDLQTHLGYSSKKPGQHELDELILKVHKANPDEEEDKIVIDSPDGLEISGFRPTPCPPEILRSFSAFID